LLELVHHLHTFTAHVDGPQQGLKDLVLASELAKLFFVHKEALIVAHQLGVRRRVRNFCILLDGSSTILEKNLQEILPLDLVEEIVAEIHLVQQVPD
jgi:hypothetical protein